MPEVKYTSATVEKVFDWVRSHPLPDGRVVPVCVWGDRGVGKTQLIRSYCQKNELGFRGFHPAHNSSGSDIVGLPMIDKESGRTIYARPKFLPSDQDSIVWDRAGVIFIDEINRATKEVLAGLMEPVGEGTIEQSGWSTPKDWSFIAAANPPREEYHVNVLDEALMDRMLHIAMGFDEVRWASWATDSGISEDMVGFVSRFPGMMAAADQDLPAEIDIKATPRSMEYLSRLYEPGMDNNFLYLLARGLIGDTAASALIQHIEAADSPVSAEEIFANDNFHERLSAHVQAGRTDLVDASQVLLLAMISRFQPENNNGQLTEGGQQQVRKVLLFMQLVGPDRQQQFLNSIHEQAPHWIPYMEQVAQKRFPAV